MDTYSILEVLSESVGKETQVSLWACRTREELPRTDGDPAEVSIVENLLRENLTAIEEAEAIEKLRDLHDYALSDLSTILGKSVSTLSEILSLNKLPTEVKDDCRNDPKAGRSILVLIAKQTTPKKMTALYKKYKESGLTVGEVRKKTAKPKPTDAPVDLSFVDQFYDRLYLLESSTLTAEQKAALNLNMVKLRGMVYQKLKLLKWHRLVISISYNRFGTNGLLKNLELFLT